MKDAVLSTIYTSLAPSTFPEKPFKMINVVYLNLVLETLTGIVESGFLQNRMKYAYEGYITDDDLDKLEYLMRLMAGDRYESVRVFFEKNMSNSIGEYLCEKNVSFI